MHHPIVSPSENETTLDSSWLILDKTMDNVSYLEQQLCEFQGDKGSKEYQFLEEEFTQKLIAIDNIDNKGSEFIKQQQKESKETLKNSLMILESKAQDQYDKSNNTISQNVTNIDPGIAMACSIFRCFFKDFHYTFCQICCGF